MPRQVTKVSVAMKLCVPLNPTAKKNTHYVCTVNDCKSTLSAAKPSNVVAHMEIQHREVFDKKITDAMLHSTEDVEELEIRRMQFIQHLTELVTINNRPLACLYDSGLRKLIHREKQFLTDAGYGVGLSAGVDKCPPAVLQYIDHLSAEVVKTIKSEVEGRLVSLLVDIGSRNNRDILGISIQYIRDGRTVIHTIGMLLLTEAHTGENINKEIIACLKKFGIKPSHVVSITSDNASNMLSMIKLFNRQGDGDENDNDESDDGASNEDLTNSDYVIADGEIDKIINEYNIMSSMTIDELEAERRSAEANEILDDTSHYLNLLKKLQNVFVLHTLTASGIKCVAHTLQLAVKSTLKTTRIRTLIAVCRMACKMMRKQSYKNRMFAQNFKVVFPKLDCKVRWNSTFKMVT